jgi:anthranilate synthase component 1
MPAGYVQHAITGNFSVEAFISHIEATHDNVFWLDDSVQSGVSYVGWGWPVASSDLGVIDAAGQIPVSLVGWIGYSQRHETLRPGERTAESAEAHTRFMNVTVAVRVDHHSGTASIIADDWNPVACAQRDEILDICSGLTHLESPPEPRVTTATWRDSTDQYAHMIRDCQEHIRNGDAYQLCLTTSATVDTGERPLTVYRRLRRLAPTHSGGFIRIDGTSLLSASPEVFVDISHGVATTKPIKGTRPRSSDPARDAQLIEELAADPKERAENLMIVDLSRNDLSKVSNAESVTVTKLFDIETYSTVHQLVSTVESRLLPETLLSAVVTALFPAGSMTGAPKRRAVEILEEIESGERGIYSGAFGRIGGGDAHLAMTIRAIVCEGDTATLGVGGGITIDSVPDNEVREVGVKAHALLTALGAEPNPFLAHR